MKGTNAMYVEMSDQAHTELLADLRSTSWTADVEKSAWAWSTRPSILRRAASSIAALIDADVNRIIATGPAAEALGTAVSLATGLQFAVVRNSEPSVGEVHPRETVAAVSFFSSDLPGADGIGTAVNGKLIALFGPEGGLNSRTVFPEEWDGQALHHREGEPHV